MKPYPAYKDSGIEWIGKIPTHWKLKRLKYIFNFNTGWTPPTGNSEYFTGKNKWVNIGDLNEKFIYNTQNYISDRAIQESRIKLSPRFSLMYSFKLTVGKVAFAGCDLYTNEAIISILPNDKDNLQFYYYLLPEILTYNSRENIYGANLLNQDLIKNSYLLLPPPEEQKIIARFLDEKICQIDSIISKKEKIIELLKEERTAVINEAVTKGLNPNAEMKDSGIEWIKKIPKHWEVERLKSVCTFAYGDSLSNEYRIEGNVPVYGSNGIVGYHNKAITEKPCIIIGRKGSFGKINFSEAECFPIDTTYFIDSRFAKCDLKWLNYVLSLLELDMFSNDTGVPGLNRDNAHNKRIPLPNINEQKIIADYLDRKTAEIDSQIENMTRAIGCLKEYRTALISEVVTGKIDVREYAV